MTHQVKEEKLTTMAVHIQRSHAEKPERHLFVITKAKDQIIAFKQGDSGLQIHTQLKYQIFSFKQNKMDNLKNKETARASLSGRLPSCMKGTTGWSQESSEYADGHQSSHSLCSLYGRFKFVLKLQHSQQCLAPRNLLTFLSSETAVKDLKLLT